MTGEYSEPYSDWDDPPILIKIREAAATQQAISNKIAALARCREDDVRAERKIVAGSRDADDRAKD